MICEKDHFRVQIEHFVTTNDAENLLKHVGKAA